MLGLHIAAFQTWQKMTIAGMLVTSLTLPLTAQVTDDPAKRGGDGMEAMQVLDSSASEFIHSDVRSVKIIIHAQLTNNDGDDIPLTLVCFAHGMVGFHSCRRLAPGEYHFRRDKGNRVSIIAHTFDRKEHELRFTVVEIDNAE